MVIELWDFKGFLKFFFLVIIWTSGIIEVAVAVAVDQETVATIPFIENVFVLVFVSYFVKISRLGITSVTRRYYSALLFCSIPKIHPSKNV